MHKDFDGGHACDNGLANANAKEIGLCCPTEVIRPSPERLAAERRGRVNLVEGGLGGAVAEVLLEAGAGSIRFRRMGLRGGFTSVVGSQQFLRERYQLDAAAVVMCTKELLGRSRIDWPSLTSKLERA